MEHKLKTHSDYFSDVKGRIKKFEVRFNDRNFQLGDTLLLQEWNPDTGYTGEELKVKVIYILNNPDYCKEGFVVLGIDH